jgi:hypothetical protein
LISSKFDRAVIEEIKKRAQTCDKGFIVFLEWTILILEDSMLCCRFLAEKEKKKVEPRTISFLKGVRGMNQDLYRFCKVSGEGLKSYLGCFG